LQRLACLNKRKVHFSLCAEKGLSSGEHKSAFTVMSDCQIQNISLYTYVVPQFTHRKNPDGSWNSICQQCYLTVVSKADTRSEAELVVAEADHVCEESNADRRNRGTHPDSK
jgi:hypothetical protein